MRCTVVNAFSRVATVPGDMPPSGVHRNPTGFLGSQKSGGFLWMPRHPWQIIYYLKRNLISHAPKDIMLVPDDPD